MNLLLIVESHPFHIFVTFYYRLRLKNVNLDRGFDTKIKSIKQFGADLFELLKRRQTKSTNLPLK